VLRSENAHFSLVWDQASRVQRLVLEALAREPAESITASEYRARYGLPTSSSVQTALEALVGDEVVAKIRRGQYRIAEPFLAEWILANAV
jgi:predicted Zn-dependent protease